MEEKDGVVAATSKDSVENEEKKEIKDTRSPSPERKRTRHDSRSPSPKRHRKYSDEEEDYHRRRRRRHDSRSPSPRRHHHHHHSERRHKHSHHRKEEANRRSKTEEKKEVSATKKLASGIYIPPFKLRQMQEEAKKDQSSEDYQKLYWENLKKSIKGIVNKVNITNIKDVVMELFAQNLIRGRGLFARAVLKAQSTSPEFTNVYAALIAIVNTKFPEIGELVLKRLIISFRKAYQRNDKPKCIAFCKFIAHLINQQVCHEILGGQLLGLLLEKPTDDSVELAVSICKECGKVMNAIAPKIVHAVFERFRTILQEGKIDKRTQYLIESLFKIRQAKFEGLEGVAEELDLVEEEDAITHELELDAELTTEDELDYYRYDPDFEENEEHYLEIKREILGEEEDGEAADDEEEEEEEEEAPTPREERDNIPEGRQSAIARPAPKDEEEERMAYKRQVYLTIMSSVDYQECVHKLLKMGLAKDKEMEIASMIIECCSQERTFLKYYGLLGQRFCAIDRMYQKVFIECFQLQYATVHRLETNKIRNISKLFGHLLYTDAIPWKCMSFMRITNEDTTPASRIFLKILFQELAQQLGLQKFTERMLSKEYEEDFNGLFMKDNPNNLKFCINFWVGCGLGQLTQHLREILNKQIEAARRAREQESSDSDSSSSSSSSSSSGESDSD